MSIYLKKKNFKVSYVLQKYTSPVRDGGLDLSSVRKTLSAAVGETSGSWQQRL